MVDQAYATALEQNRELRACLREMRDALKSMTRSGGTHSDCSPETCHFRKALDVLARADELLGKE